MGLSSLLVEACPRRKFQTHEKGYYFALTDDSGEHIQAAFPAYHVSSWLTGDRMVSVPFANICDPLILKTEDFTRLLEAVKDIS